MTTSLLLPAQKRSQKHQRWNVGGQGSSVIWWGVQAVVRWCAARCPLTVRLTGGSSEVIDRSAPLCSFRGQRSPPLQTCFPFVQWDKTGRRAAAAAAAAATPPTLTPLPPHPLPPLFSLGKWGRRQLKRFSLFRFSSHYLLKLLFKGGGDSGGFCNSLGFKCREEALGAKLLHSL